MAGEIVQELYSLLGLKVDQQSWARGDKFLGAVKAGFTAVIAGFGIHQIEKMISSVADVADAAGKSAQKLGITTEAVQELGYAAKLSDIEQVELEASMTKLAKGLDEVAQTGKGPAADALKRLGISAKELKGESLDQNLEVIADAFQKLPDGPAKAAIAMDLFGKSGGKLIPLLNSGQEGIVELRNEAQRLGLVVGTETAKQFEEFNDQQSKLGATWEGLKVQVVSALLPSLQKLVEKFQGWIDTHRELIASGLTAVINGLTMAFDGLAVVLDVVAKVVEFFQNHAEFARAVIISLGVALGVLAAQAAIAWIAAAAPVIAFAAVVAGVVLVVEDVWKSIQTGKGRAADAWRYITNSVDGFVRNVKQAPTDILNAFIGLGDGIRTAINGAFDWLIDQAKNAASTIWKEIKDIPIIGDIAGGVESIVKPVDIGGKIPQDLSGFFNSAPTPSIGDMPGLFDSAPAQMMPAPSAPSMSATFGGVTQTIQAAPGMSEERLAQIAATEVEKAQGRMLSDAFDSMRGGVR